eukprot:2107600-Rhodomonas_salina.1
MGMWETRSGVCCCCCGPPVWHARSPGPRLLVDVQGRFEKSPKSCILHSEGRWQLCAIGGDTSGRGANHCCKCLADRLLSTGV